MALQQIRIGSSDNVVQYDDGVYDSAVETDQPIKAGTPSDPNDVVRLSDLGSYVTGPAASVADNLASFDGVTGKKLKDSGLSTAGVSAAVAASHGVNDVNTSAEPAGAVATHAALDVGVHGSSGVNTFEYAAAIADDGTVALPTILANYAAKVEVIISSAGIIDANATFMIDSTGTVTPQVDSGNCVYNVDTDVKLCIGTAAAQNPLTIKYRLGSAVAKIMILMKYVKS